MVFPSFKERIIDRYKPDIFIDTWSDEGWWAPTEGKTGLRDGAPAVHDHELISAYSPMALRVEEFDDHYLSRFEERAKEFTNFYHRPKNSLSMFYKLASGIRMMENHQLINGGEYDLVIRMRPDVILNKDLPDFDPAKFYTLDYKNHMGTGTSDMFQIGSPESLGKFARLGLNIRSLYQQTGLFCPHVLSEQHIKNCGLNWEQFHLEFNRDLILQHTPNGPYRAS
jgi:hypothetical protein